MRAKSWLYVLAALTAIVALLVGFMALTHGDGGGSWPMLIA
jgi:hypothetical protein